MKKLKEVAEAIGIILMVYLVALLMAVGPGYIGQFIIKAMMRASGPS